MVSKHQKTPALIFQNPIRSDVKWADIIALLQHMGAEISEGKGTEIDKGALKSMRRFLVEAGVRP